MDCGTPLGVLQYMSGGESECSARKLQVLKSLSYLVVNSSGHGLTVRETGVVVMRVLTGKILFIKQQHHSCHSMVVFSVPCVCVLEFCTLCCFPSPGADNREPNAVRVYRYRQNQLQRSFKLLRDSQRARPGI